MPDEAVLDASVAIKIFLDEEGSEKAHALATSGAQFAAPDVVLAETANVLLKRLRRGELSRAYAEAALERMRTLFDELVSAESLMQRGFSIAAAQGTSAYDGLYVALAEQKGWPLATADHRLVERIRRSDLPIEIWTL
jgi:predicted nucleic acid-binding protein